MLAIIAAALASAPATATPPRAENCTMPAGWAAVAAVKPRFVVFGENHGTTEAPTFVGEVVCALASRAKRVLIAIEWPAEDNAAIQAAWRLRSGRFDPAIRQAGLTRREDGKGSVAMFAMLSDLHRAKAAGRLISVVAFDMGVNGARDEPPRRRPTDLTEDALREGVQADNILAAANAGRYDHVIVLTGNVHARKVPVTYGGVSYEPMAMRLARSGRLVSLNARTAGGSAWGCRLRQGATFVPGKPLPVDAIACGAHPVRADPAAGAARSIALTPTAASEDAAAYDGVFDLGPVTASPPALPAAGAPRPGGG